MKKTKIKKRRAGINILKVIGPFYLIFAAFLTALGAQYFLFMQKQLVPGLLFSLAAVVLFILADIAAGKNEENTDKMDKRLEIILFVFVIAVGVFFRVYMIDTTPTGCYRDEGQNGNEAINIMNGTEMDGTALPVYIERDTQNSAMFMYFIAASFKSFGIGVMQIRLISIILGILAIAAFYFFTRSIFGPYMAVAGGLLFAVARWHVNFSRIGFLGIHTVLLAVMVLYFAYRAYKNKTWLDFALVGFISALGFHSYIAGRLIAPAIFLFFIFVVLKDFSLLKKNFKKIILAVCVFLITFAPLGVYIIKHLEQFMMRTATVSIFNKDMLKAIGGVYTDAKGEVKPWQQLYMRNLGKTLLMFNYIGDGNPRHNFDNRPMLDFLMGTMALLGFGYALYKIFNPFYFLMVSFFMVLLQAGLASIESPQAYRTITVIPVVIMFAVIFIAKFWQFFKLQFGADKLFKKLILGILIMLIGYIAYDNYQTYFKKQVNDSGFWAEFSTNEWSMGRYFKSLNPAADPGWTAIVMPDWYHSYTFKFASYPYQSTNVVPFELSEWIPIKLKAPGNFVYILDASYLPIRPVLEKMYPNGKYSEFKHKMNGRILYWAYEVLAGDVVKNQTKKQENGLQGLYYRGNEWKGPVMVKKIDPFILFNWTVDPVLGPFSVKWTGRLKIDKAGSYIFQTRSNDFSDLVIDGKTIVKNSGTKPYQYPAVRACDKCQDGMYFQSGTVSLAEGYHTIALRYYESINYSRMQLWWQTPGKNAMEVVNNEVIFPN